MALSQLAFGSAEPGRVSKTVEIINQSIPGMKEGLSFLKPFFLQV
jgi:hypothetical protein